MKSSTHIGSHTSISQFENCPRAFNHKYVLKALPKEDSEPLRQGILVHELFEKRLSGARTPFPGPYAYLEKWAAPVAGDHLTIKVEDKLAMTASGKATGFFSDDVWFRSKADVLVLKWPVAVLFDWKTGKRREDPSELAVFSLLLKLKYPGIDKVRGHYVWLKEDAMGAPHDLTETASVMARIRNTMADIQAATDAGVFPPKENALCGWCPVIACEFNRRKS